MWRGRETAWEYLHRMVATRHDDQCWIWPFQLSQGKWKYGQVFSPRPEHKLLRTHKVAFQLRFGHWPQPCGLHKCDVPSCFNPDHVWEGTLKDNSQDMLAKGRNRYIIPPPARGACNHFAKLTDDDVREIIARYVPRKVSQYKLAAEFGVSQSVISLIISRKGWSHVSL